jgi:hypothetical protein
MDAGVAIRAHLLPQLMELVDRYCAEHYDGQPLANSHARALNDLDNEQLEDFLGFIYRQPETVWIVDGQVFGMMRGVMAEFDAQTGKVI